MHHGFDVQEAIQYGIEEAILLAHFKFWIEKNRADGRNRYNGRHWTFTSVRALAKHFPYMNPRTIFRKIDHLMSENVIIRDNFNQRAMDRTAWYALVEEDKIFKYIKVDTIRQNDKWIGQNGEALPDSPTDKRDAHAEDEGIVDSSEWVHLVKRMRGGGDGLQDL